MISFHFISVLDDFFHVHYGSSNVVSLSGFCDLPYFTPHSLFALAFERTFDD